MICRPSGHHQLSRVSPGPEQRAEIDRLLGTYQSSFAAFVEESLAEKELRTQLSARFAEAEPVLAAVHRAVAARGEAILAEVAAASRQSRTKALTLGLALWLCVAIMRPLRAIRTALERMMAGDYSHPLPGTRIAESAAISEAVETFRHDLSLKDRVDREVAEVIAACAAGDFSRRLDLPEDGNGAAELVRGVNAIGEAAQTGLCRRSGSVIPWGRPRKRAGQAHIEMLCELHQAFAGGSALPFWLGVVGV